MPSGSVTTRTPELLDGPPPSQNHAQPAEGDSTEPLVSKTQDVSGTHVAPDSLAKTQRSVDIRDISQESMLCFFLQSLPPLLLAGMGLIGTGLLLHKWQNTLFYRRLPEAMMLTPALLGLKGNLEMTFASRLATLAHLGKMDQRQNQVSIGGANLALVQTQAVLVSLFATAITIATSAVTCTVLLDHVVLLAGAAVSATSMSSLILFVSIMIMVLVARACQINPDNIIAPLAASFGDFITLLMFVGCGSLSVIVCQFELCWLSLTALGLFGLAVPVCGYLAYRNIYTRPTLLWGWFSIVFAASVSCAGGFLLERAVRLYENAALFQPLLSGLAGNRAAIHCSRLSSTFHITCDRLGAVAEGDSFRRRLNPWHSFNGKDIHSQTALVLVVTALPFHLLFLVIIILTNGTLDLFNWPLIGFYLLAALIQIVFLVYMAQLVVFTLWWIGTDPDHSAIPILTSTSDLLGCAMIFGVFAATAQIDLQYVGIVHNASNSTESCDRV